jgi:hypothetical protein
MRALSLLLVALLSACATAGTTVEPVTAAAADPQRTWSAADVRADFTALYDGLKSAHYDLFAYRTKVEYDARFAAGLQTIQSAHSMLDVIRLFQPFVAYGRVGHARLDFPVQEYIAAAHRQEKILPFDLRFLDGRAFVTHNYSGDARLSPGTEIVAIDGRPIAEERTAVAIYISAERDYFVDAQLEEYFPRWLWVHRGSVEEFAVDVRNGEVASRIEIAGVPILEAEPLKSKWTIASHERELRLLDGGIAWLRPGPFYEPTAADAMDPTAFRAFVDDAFRKIIDAGTESLVIDVRNNPGGDNSFSDHLISWFATKPFRFSSEFRIKASPETLEAYRPKAGANPDEIGAALFAAVSKHAPGEKFVFDLPYAQPRGGERYRGRVFVLVNRHSYSNAASMAALIQDYGFGTVIGEETADLPTSLASSEKFTLPRTGIVVTYPKGSFIRPNGDRALRGVVPTFTIESPRPGSSGSDEVLARALEVVRSGSLSPAPRPPM